jgi:ATP adenylyltransferase
MENLWTPWRMTYIVENTSREGCLFCELLESSDEPRYILRESAHGFLILNVYPYTAGHLMVVPYRHVASLTDLGDEERDDLLSLAAAAERAQIKAYGCRSVIGGVNMGRVAGAGVVGHVHIHLVPRRHGDAGRSEDACGSSAPPEELGTTFRRLDQALGDGARAPA